MCLEDPSNTEKNFKNTSPFSKKRSDTPTFLFDISIFVAEFIFNFMNFRTMNHRCNKSKLNILLNNLLQELESKEIWFRLKKKKKCINAKSHREPEFGWKQVERFTIGFKKINGIFIIGLQSRVLIKLPLMAFLV